MPLCEHRSNHAVWTRVQTSNSTRGAHAQATDRPVGELGLVLDKRAEGLQQSVGASDPTIQQSMRGSGEGDSQPNNKITFVLQLNNQNFKTSKYN